MSDKLKIKNEVKKNISRLRTITGILIGATFGFMAGHYVPGNIYETIIWVLIGLMAVTTLIGGSFEKAAEKDEASK